MFLLIDNYDSFTYNLVQAFYALGHEPVVLRNDDPAILDMAADPALEMVCISPGPGHPSQTGCMRGRGWMWGPVSCTANSPRSCTTAAACSKACPIP